MSDKRESHEETEEETKKGPVSRWILDPIEFIGNKLPHPVMLFVILAVLVIVGSAILSAMGVSVADPEDPGEVVEVTNLLSGEGVSYIFESMVDNFINFPPLGVVLATMLGIGIAER